MYIHTERHINRGKNIHEGKKTKPRNMGTPPHWRGHHTQRGQTRGGNMLAQSSIVAVVLFQILLDNS